MAGSEGGEKRRKDVKNRGSLIWEQKSSLETWAWVATLSSGCLVIEGGVLLGLSLLLVTRR